MQINASEMSTTKLEMPLSESPNKEKSEINRLRSVKEIRSLKKPSFIPTGLKNKLKSNTGIHSTTAKVESSENNAGQLPTHVSKSRASSVSAAHNANQKRILENQYITKKKRYLNLKKELIDKHKNAVELYENMSQLREKVIALGAKDPGKLEEVRFSLSSSSEDKHLDPVIASGAGEEPQVQLPDPIVTNEFVLTMESKLQAIPEVCLTLCQEVLTKRTEILSWLEPFFLAKELDESGNEIKLDPVLMKQVETFQIEDISLREKLESTKKNQNELIADLVKQSEVLWTESQFYRNKIKEVESSGGTKLKENLISLTNQLKAEQEKFQQLKERKTLLETNLQKLRTKVRELEGQVSTGETKIHQLQTTVKQLEGQVKQKEASLEQRAKELLKVTKGYETTISKLEKQKENLESRLIEMTSELTEKSNSESTVQQMNQKLEERNSEISQEKQKRLQIEVELKELKERYAVLEQKSQELLKLEQEKNFSKPKNTSSSNHSNNELRLYNELQAAKVTIEKQEERIDQMKREREEFVSVMKKAASREGCGETNSKLAADLLAATHELKLFKEENAQLEKKIKAANNKSENFEKQLMELQARLQVQSKEGGKAGFNAFLIELQQQNSDLKCNLKELAQQNEQLEAELSQKQVELDCVKHNQNKLLRAREEVMSHIKPISPVKLVGEVEEGIDQQMASKADELKEILATLESKQMQVMQLEKMVKQMEDQQDRAQAQRTRFEARIAHLELAAKEKNQRYIKERCVPSLNLSKSPRHNSPPVLLQPTVPPNFQELEPSPRNKILELKKTGAKTWNSLNLKSPRPELSSRFSPSQEEGKSPKENSGHKKRLEGGGFTESPRYLRTKSPKEALAYEMRESLYDWLIRPSKSPRKVDYECERYSYPVRSSIDEKMKSYHFSSKDEKLRNYVSSSKDENLRNYVSSSKDEKLSNYISFSKDENLRKYVFSSKNGKLRNEYVEGFRRQNPSSRESLNRGYKKRSFRAYRPNCDYQSPRKPTPKINVRRYTT